MHNAGGWGLVIKGGCGWEGEGYFGWAWWGYRHVGVTPVAGVRSGEGAAGRPGRA